VNGHRYRSISPFIGAFLLPVTQQTPHHKKGNGFAFWLLLVSFRLVLVSFWHSKLDEVNDIKGICFGLIGKNLNGRNPAKD